MLALGYPQFYITQDMLKKESRHNKAQCNECHLGDETAKEANAAHKGMLKPLFISAAGKVIERKKPGAAPLLPEGSDRTRALLPENSETRNILWHDRDPETFNFDPKIAEKTCGKAGCHPQELKQFRTTVMGANFRQRTMKTWTKPYGPHNCGPSFADTPPVPYLNKPQFAFSNTEEITRNLNTGFSKEQAIAKQKFCNVCHAGCLDCHYSPGKEKGTHSFIKRPDSETCSGNGRGTSMCHPGAMNSRRGESYIGNDYSTPQGRPPDIHYKNNIHCVDCHKTGNKGMGDIQRKAECTDCHSEIKKAQKNGIHKNLDCAACHINELGGYQVTTWGPGHVAGETNPFKKYSLYYGIQKPPILIKDQKGIWIPVKVWPHSVGNIKEDVKPSGRIMFRWPGGETRDAYYTLGTVDGLPGNNKHLLWLEIEQAAHSYGKARGCESCHSSEAQVSVSTWEFEDEQGAEPFSGTHRIVADRNSLRIEGLRNTTPITAIGDSKPEDFAAWLYMKDKWKAPGDFSIRIDNDKYRKAFKAFRKIDEHLKALEAESKRLDEKTKVQYKNLKGAMLHNPDGAGEKIAQQLKLLVKQP